jgi:hypothetical protein
VPRINDDTQAYPLDWVRDNPITTTERMTMTERTITETELKEALSTTALIIGCPTYNDIVKAAFPIPFTPKEGEIIWVRGGEDERWVLRIFISAVSGYYRCEVDSIIKWFDWRQAKPQTPTQKGEG